MWKWLAENSSSVQAAVGAITALVWIFYLQILVSGLHRQRRTAILIHLGGSQNLDARMFISNLGFEPIYILDIILSIWSTDGERTASVADRMEISQQDLSDPSAATFQGPLKSAEFIDVGSFEELLQRARTSTSDSLDPAQISRLEIKVAAISAASSGVVASKRQFYVAAAEGEYRITPQALYGAQIQSWWGRYSLRRELEAKLKR